MELRKNNKGQDSGANRKVDGGENSLGGQLKLVLGAITIARVSTEEEMMGTLENADKDLKCFRFGC